LGYRPALDGIRAVAIACVLLAHTIGFSEGFVGVYLFFALSGFLITTLLLEEHAREGRVSFPDFYRRRALRLLPALFAVLAAFLAYAVLESLYRGGSLDRAIFGVVAGLGYFSNIALAAETEPGTGMPSALRHLWSLAIEEQFYLLWPPVLFLVLGGRRRLALVALGILVVLAAVQQTWLYLDGASEQRIAYGTDTGSTSILVGCVLAVALTTVARSRLEASGVWVTPLAIAGFLALLFVNAHGSSLFSVWVLALALCCACLILRALDDRSVLARALSLRPLVFLGRISYALYLWHLPIYVVLGLGPSAELLDIPALALALGCATASYYFVEVPFLRRKNRPAPQPAEKRPVAVPA
jgi:peptidoglycan/LPS O-acetylase OafA/YrhL